jgi:hypothetical protein
VTHFLVYAYFVCWFITDSQGVMGIHQGEQLAKPIQEIRDSV